MRVLKTIETTFETELNRIVYAKVVRGEYPDPVAYVSDAEQREELAGLRAGTIDRPATKLGYINRLAQLEAQIKDIAKRNEQIDIENTAARKAIDDKYIADIAAAKLEEVNLMAAVRSYRNYLISQCDWTQIPDAPLTVEQKTAWQEYRQALRDIPQNYATAAAVVWPTPPA